MDSRDMLITLDILCNHVWLDIYDKIKNKDTEFLDDPNNILIADIEKYKILHDGYKIVCMVDEEYPREILKERYQTPFVIYYKGDLDTVAERFLKTRYDSTKGCFLD